MSFLQFTFELTILNFPEFSSTDRNLEMLGKGSYGKVYKGIDEKQIHNVIKTIPYKSFENHEDENDESLERKLISKNLERAIMEYCFCKLFSALKVGPRMLMHCGFDMIIFNDSIEFCMESCSKPK